ncbi:Holliday junction branch migration protein RuvA [Shuttleworthella satelles]|uniref:Holliday junction branch migration complex subunit RuvA n=1 Tax=Shuttleworthella satelles DSM 14600 TaxID=626523 RepID=C4GBB6_9FIRM|nr:Holliday junction branch migration protein RuvA [Shuttleworthia satelles]EEP28409.1 Holliday junction DNA helicase RuvA [Shuttleworthia satelles DSM 14600]
MFSYIQGRVEEINPEGIVLDHDGIGYEIGLPQSSLSQIRRQMQLRVYTYLQVRDDGFSLFGFLKREDLDLFKLLIGVGGIGPKGALSILGVLSVDQLRFAIAAGDDKTIAQAPGIGKKTAQRVILDLRDKIDFTQTLEAQLDSKASDRSSDDIRGEAILALNALGYSSAEALQAIRDLDISSMSVEDLIRAGLKELALR